MSEGSGWLTPVELQAWRGLLRMNDLLVSRTSRTMQAEYGLSGADYTVLAELTRIPDGRLSVSELADVLAWELSRLSHQLSRMAKRDLVMRQECAEDRRRSYVVVTPTGRAAIEAAAPRHVQDVRRLFFAPLTLGQITLLAEITQQVINHLDALD
ncbi:MarR family winged helix-turn-helix transcriptional regulator [Nonomuraea sp. ZG12]|uniref:MarR family winged helix-turn-helix transcriptional regulator n=1 Tax=Nonomuraea sp. ZG12 TaxID=3452207 RepID=UPI003F8934A7